MQCNINVIGCKLIKKPKRVIHKPLQSNTSTKIGRANVSLLLEIYYFITILKKFRKVKVPVFFAYHNEKLMN